MHGEQPPARVTATSNKSQMTTIKADKLDPRRM